MYYKKHFDILNIQNKDYADIIQSLMGNDCLGSFYDNGETKLYFQAGIKDKIEYRMIQINSELTLNWEWDTQDVQDWHLKWQDNFNPVIIEKKLAVIPHWSTYSKEDIIIKIKPGMAFGTGHHETTWLMLSQMMKKIKVGTSVLDLGCGSGILSIAAIKLGANKVDAIDNDLSCVDNFNENLKLNYISEGICYYNQDVLEWSCFNYDLIVANINKNIIESLLPMLPTIKTTILLSGLLDIDYQDIIKRCQKYNHKIKDKVIKGEWICLTI